MSDNSLFSKHMRLIEGNESLWSAEDRKEHGRLSNLRLPRLELKPSKFEEYKTQIQIGLSMFALASLIVIVMVNQREHETFTAKGSVQVSVIWERAGKVSKLSEEAVLQDGDKIGASVISSDEAVAYWSITDNNMKVLSGAEDIEASKIILEPGVSKSFTSSFELTAPNQGENLVVAICPKATAQKSGVPKAEVFDLESVSRLQTEPQVRGSECIFVGYRLRKLP